MTKREFLKELEDRLQMLDEKERKDMIEEYSQQYVHEKWDERRRSD